MMPLIRALKNQLLSVNYLWYADDASVAGNLYQVIKFFHKLCAIGPSFGSFSEESKRVLIILSEKVVEAREHCKINNCNFEVKGGNHYLARFVGDKDLETQWVKDKIHSWASAVDELSTIAMLTPQTACATAQRALQHQWNFHKGFYPM